MNPQDFGMRTHPLRNLLEERQMRNTIGIPSACTANRIVIEACVESARKMERPICIEATANQVNQMGGYTGMRPEDFAALVLQSADDIGLDRRLVVLGGDHLGPLVWRKEPSEQAMEKARELVRAFTLAGFTKLHLDTSMRLGGDDPTKPLPLDLAAERASSLAKEAEKAYLLLKEVNPDAIHPVYVIGSEVPAPGGSPTEESGLEITSPENAIQCLEAFREAFETIRTEGAWEQVVALVVQPGVEFSSEHVHEYSRDAARRLVSILDGWPDLVFEGHSTDYQPNTCLERMVEDGIAILKVGPALTFALREGLFALADIETELRDMLSEPACFRQVLESCMVEDPSHWHGHYRGSESSLHLQRRFSYFDRSRYYLPDVRVETAYRRLFANLDRKGIPMTLMSQYLPIQYRKIREGMLKCDAETLVKDCVQEVLGGYWNATRPRRRDKE